MIGMESKINQITAFVTIVSIQYILSQTVSEGIEPTKSSKFISTSLEAPAVTYNNLETSEWISSNSPATEVTVTFSSGEVNSQVIDNQTYSSRVTDSTIPYTTSTQAVDSMQSLFPSSGHFSSFISNSKLYTSSVFKYTSLSETASQFTVSTIGSSTNVLFTSKDISRASLHVPSSLPYSSITYSSVTQSSVTHSSVTHSSVTHSSVTHSSVTHYSTTTTALSTTSTKFAPPAVGLSTGGKVAVGILVVVAVIIIVAVGMYCFRKRRKFGSFSVPYKRWTTYGTPEDEIHLSFNEERL